MNRREFLEGAAGLAMAGPRPILGDAPTSEPSELVPARGTPLRRRPLIGVCGWPQGMRERYVPDYPWDGWLSWSPLGHEPRRDGKQIGQVWCLKLRRPTDGRQWWHDACEQAIEHAARWHSGEQPPRYFLLGNEPLNASETNQPDAREFAQWYVKARDAVSISSRGRTMIGAAGQYFLGAEGRDWWATFADALDMAGSALDLIHVHAYLGDGDVQHYLDWLRREAEHHDCYSAETPLWCTEFGHLWAGTCGEALPAMDAFMSWALQAFDAVFWFVTWDADWASRSPGTMLYDAQGQLTSTGQRWLEWREAS